MHSEDEFFQNDRANDLWQRFCGFLSLSLDEFVHIQTGLLKEQIGYISRGIFQDNLIPPVKFSSIDEFRSVMPLRRYEDYIHILGEGKDEVLKEKPEYWVHTSAVRGSYKRVPWTSRFDAVQRRNVISALVLSSAQDSGDIKLSPGCRVLHLLPERPFASAFLAHGLQEQLTIRAIPPIGEEGNLIFTKRIDHTITLGLKNNVDYAIAMTSSLLKMADRFNQVCNKTGRNPLNLVKLHPQVTWHLLNRKNHGRFLPVDAWALKGVVCWGADSAGLAGSIEKQWGKKPLQVYGSSEGGIMSMQDWQKGALAFLPDVVFLEFIPEELVHSQNPQTVLIDEVQDGKVYELVITNFYGMPLIRYRQGDLVRIVKDKTKTGGVPRMVFLSRADDIIDVFGISRINKSVLSEAITNAGLSSENWYVHKEYEDSHIAIKIYVETDRKETPIELEQALNRELKKIDRHWREAVYTMAYNPIRLNVLPTGSLLKLGLEIPGNFSPRSDLPRSILEELKRLGEAKR